LARMATPTNPPTSPIRRRGPMRSPKKTNATSAVNITVMALVMAPMPAGARSAPQANRANGMTELMAAMPAMRSHSAGVNCAVAAAVVVHSDADMRLKSPPVQHRSVSQALKRGRAGSSPATRYLRPAPSTQRPLEVLEQILGRLDADRKTQQSVADPEARPLLG